MYEEIKIEKNDGHCQLCDDYVKKDSTVPTKVAILSCEGACARGEVSRRAANLIAHKLSPNNTVRICLGCAFTKDSGQRNLVRETHKAIAVEGCSFNCSSVIPDLKPLVINADTLYETCLPFGIEEVSCEDFDKYAKLVAEEIVQKYYADQGNIANAECAATGGSSKSSCCCK